MTSNPGENSHNYDHDHEVLKYNDDSAHDYDEMGRYALMSEALKELLIEKNVVSANEVREYLDFMDSRGEHVGAEIIAKAWTRSGFQETADDRWNCYSGRNGCSHGRCRAYRC